MVPLPGSTIPRPQAPLFPTHLYPIKQIPLINNLAPSQINQNFKYEDVGLYYRVWNSGRIDVPLGEINVCTQEYLNSNEKYEKVRERRVR